MDHEISRLSRAVTKSPDDSQLARMLDSALLRVGRRGCVEERLRQKFLCPARWVFSLDLRSSRCFECSRDIECAPSVEDAVASLDAGRSVVVAADDVNPVLARVAGRPALHTALEDEAPCIVRAGASPIDSPLARRLLAEASVGSPKAPLILSEIAVSLVDASEAWHVEDALRALTLPAPPPVAGPPHRAREEYADLHARRASVAEAELLHDALLHARDHWSMEEYVRLDREIDPRRYNAQDAVAAMILLVSAVLPPVALDAAGSSRPLGVQA